MTEITTQGDTAIVCPGQNIVAAMTQNFRDELRLLLAKGITNIVIDLTGVEIIDSMGLSVLVAVHNSLQKKGTRLEIRNAVDNINKLMGEMRLDRHFILTPKDA